MQGTVVPNVVSLTKSLVSGSISLTVPIKLFVVMFCEKLWGASQFVQPNNTDGSFYIEIIEDLTLVVGEFHKFLMKWPRV